MMNSLKMIKLEFTLTAAGEFRLPCFMGNTLRGAIGKALVKLYCEKDAPDCDLCVNRDRCVYSNVFKCKYVTEYIAESPNPFVIEVGRGKHIFKPGDVLHFSVVLMGKAIHYADCFINAVRYLADNGFIERNLPFNLTSVKDVYSDRLLDEKGGDEPDYVEWNDSFQPIETEHISIEFITPFLYSGQNYTNLTFYEFMDRTFDRIASLIDVYGENEFVIPYNFAFHKNKVKTVCRLKKYIVKQKNKDFETSVGTVDFYGKLSRYLPYIALGSEVHFGKMSTRGLGQYKMTVL